jgi:hypothetical protein
VAHWPQKANPGGLAKPHWGHGPVSGVAHRPQNFIPAGFSNPQLGQRIHLLLSGARRPNQVYRIDRVRYVWQAWENLACQYSRPRHKSREIPVVSQFEL